MRDPAAEVIARDAKEFLRVLAATTLLFVVPALAFVAWGNVWGNYGDAGFFFTYNDRRGKSESLIAMDTDKLAEAWIIGGSAIYPLLPSEVERQFGLRAYSTANFWARMDDNFAWLNFVLFDLGVRPKLIVLGLETWTFRPDGQGPVGYRHLRRRLVNAPLLARHLPDYNPLRIRVARALDLFSSQQLRLTVNALRRGRRRVQYQPAGSRSEVFFHPDGSGPYSEENPESYFGSVEINQFYGDLIHGLRDETSRSTAAVRERLLAKADEYFNRWEIDDFFPGEAFSSREIELFEGFAQLTADRGIPLIIVLLPVHPYFEDVLISRTQHRAHRQTLLDLVVSAAERHGENTVIVDATDLRDFDGDPMAWHDRLHMKPSNGARVVRLARQAWEAR